VLGAEALAAAVAVVLGLLGQHGWPFGLIAAAFPVLVLGIVKCWPHRDEDADAGLVGYNGVHG
jgi:hypothetical protein